MHWRSDLVRIVILVLVLLPIPSAAFEPDPGESPAATGLPNPTQLAEGWFHRLYGFDALQAFESKRGPVQTTEIASREGPEAKPDWDAKRARELVQDLTRRLFW